MKFIILNLIWARRPVVRSAGSVARLMAIEGSHAQVQLPSGEIRIINKDCFASIGIVSNIDHSNIKLREGRRKRWMGDVRSARKAMNPIDHPHGGGEGTSLSVCQGQKRHGEACSWFQNPQKKIQRPVDSKTQK